MFGELLLDATAHRLKVLGAALPASSGTAHGVFWVRSGPSSNIDNGVVGTPDEAGATASLLRPFQATATSASWLLARDPPRGVLAALASAGCTPDEGGSAMGAELALIADRSRPSNLHVVRVTDQVGLDQWFEVASASGWFPRDATDRKEIYRSLCGPSSAMRFYVATESSRPIGMATAVFSEHTVLLDGIFVAAPYRRQGVATALVDARLTDARLLGCVHAVLAPSPEGRELYEPLGFVVDPFPPMRWWHV
jgi:GNAT superfamily N-acetyltransferase